MSREKMRSREAGREVLQALADYLEVDARDLEVALLKLTHKP